MKDLNAMTTREIVARYSIRLTSEGRLEVCNTRAAKIDGIVEELKKKKGEIIAYLEAEKVEQERAASERKAKIESIEGLTEIRNAIEDKHNYRIAFNKMMDDESNDGVFPPESPKANLDELKARYPRASAYVKAESWYRSENFVKSNAGKKAMEKIVNGCDYNIVIADMEKEFDDYCDSNVWD